jgi:hypothetical protein
MVLTGSKSKFLGDGDTVVPSRRRHADLDR